MQLKEIYKPIEKDLKKVSSLIEASFKGSENSSIENLGRFLLESPGKRIRPALVILSAKATLSHQSPVTSHQSPVASHQSPVTSHQSPVTGAPVQQLIKVASAIELIHMASLLHDDVIDHSDIRHNKPTINSKWGKDVAITLGDYIYSVAFELVSLCNNPDIIQCISSATKAMCEGELVQVCERDNLNLLKERYIVIVRKKTASLFAASCQTGALISNSSKPYHDALKEYGLNLGIAFQIVDDYLDLVGEEKKLGKKPGQDIGVGEMTLPVLNLLESAKIKKRKNLKKQLSSNKDKAALKKIKSMLFDSGAAAKTKETVSSYIKLAQKKLNIIPDSIYKENLGALANFIMERGFLNDN